MWNKNIYCALFGIILVAVVDVRAQTSITCYSCDSIPNCAAAVTSLSPTTCEAGVQCVTVFVNTTTISFRGCANSPAPSAACPLVPGNCQNCQTPNCNAATQKEEPISCYQCNSYNNSNCVWNPTAVTTTAQCDQKCVVALVPKSTEDHLTYETYRGCLSGLPAGTKCDGTDLCWPCNNSSNCNTVNEPSSRLTCNYCTDTPCTAVAPQLCLSYRPNDKCVYVLKNDSSISSLGCASAFDSSTIPYMIGMGELVECDGPSCNTLANKPNVNTTAVSCVSCSSDTDPSCATNPSDVKTTVDCGGLNKACITDITATGSTVRGCLAAQSQTVFMECYSGGNATYCNTCNTTNCNNQVFPPNRLSCYQCNSGNDKNCESNPTNSTICPTYKADETCIQYKSNNTIYRGCSSQLSCNNNTEKCTTCSESGCNNKSGSAAIQSTGFLMIASLIIAIFSVISLK